MARRKKVTKESVLKELESYDSPVNIKDLSSRLGLSERYVLIYLRSLLDSGDIVKTYNLLDMRSALYSIA